MDCRYIQDLFYFDYILPKLTSNCLRTDAHIHTALSDGIESFDTTCRRIQESEIDFFSITDHNHFPREDSELDCLTSTRKPFVYGCEFSCSYDGVRVHVLGYYLRNHNPKSNSIIQRIHDGHSKREQIRIAKMKQAKDINLSYDYFVSINQGKVPNWRRIAQALVDSGDASTIEEASELYLRPGKCGYLSYSDDWPKVNAVDAVKAICYDGGIPVLAHLGDLQKQLGDKSTVKLINVLCENGLVGYDISAGGKHLPIPMNILAICNERFKLLPVYGTDCHNADFNNIYTPASVDWFKALLLSYSKKY